MPTMERGFSGRCVCCSATVTILGLVPTEGFEPTLNAF